MKLKLDTCNILKNCMLNIKNHWNRTILKGTFFFAPIKWATSGLVRSAQNWFQSMRYIVKIIRKNSQPKNRCLLRFKGNFLIWPLTPKSFKHPYNVVKIDFLDWKFFSYNLNKIPLRLKPVLSRSDQTGSSSFYRGREESAL